MPLLEVRDLRSGYKHVPVLHGVSFDVAAGEIVTIVGSNGAGETTLLKTVSGLLAPFAGEIHLDGQPIHGLPSHRIVERGVVQVPEGRQLFGHLTVRENLVVGSHLREARARRAETLAMVLELFPVLAEREEQLARTLSGGEQQMLTMGRTLMGNPELLLVDEPTEGLAPMIVEQVEQILGAIHRSGTPVLLVEQSMETALALAQRVYVMSKGQIVFSGTMRELQTNESVRKEYLEV